LAGNKKKMERIIIEVRAIRFGNKNLPKEHFRIYNIITIMGKYHIHKCKWQNKNSSILVFKIDEGILCFFETSERLQ